VADRVYEIEFKTTAVDTGAQQVQQDINDVTAATQAANTALQGIDNKAMADLESQVSSLKKEANDLVGTFQSVKQGGTASAEGIKEATVATEQFEAKIPGIASSIQGLSSQFNSGGTSAQGWAKSISAVTTETGSLGIKMIGLAGIIGGFIGAISIVESASKDFADWILSMGEAAVDATTAIEKLENVRLDLKDQRKAVQGFVSDIREAIEESKEFERVANAFQDQKASTDKARIEARAKTDIAAAGGDPTAEAAIKARAAIEIAAVDNARALQKIDSDIQQENREIFFLKQQKKGIEERIQQALIKEENATKKIEEVAQSLGKSFEEAVRLGESTERLNKAIENAATIAEGSSLKALGQAVQTRTSAQDVTKSAQTEVNQADSKIEQLLTSIATSQLKREEEQLNQQSQSIDLGSSSMSALQAIEKAIRDQERKVDESRRAVSTAQATAGGVEQGAAQSVLASNESELARLRGLYDSAAAAVKQGSQTFGDSFTQGAQSIQDAATKAQKSLDSAKDSVNDISDIAVKSVSDAATKVVESTTTATGNIAGSVDKLGVSVMGGFTKVGSAIEQVAASVESQIRLFNQRLANAETDAKNADDRSKKVASQVANMR